LIASGIEGLHLQSACLRVAALYHPHPPSSSDITASSIEESLTFILSELGIKVKQWDQSCETIIDFTIRFEALKANYLRLGECYTGASAEVWTTITLPEHKPVAKKFSGTLPPPLVTSMCPQYDTLFNTPFRAVWQEPVMLSLLYLFGSPVLVPAALSDEIHDVAVLRFPTTGAGIEEVVAGLIRGLRSKDDMKKRNAVRALEAIGPPARSAVPALIERVRTTRSRDQWEASWALEAITGQDFGEDADAWQKWWEKQP
jgi:hypothetical protein